MTKTAWVFPGQGSQAVGMGVGLENLPTGQAKLATAADILGWSILDICQGDEAILSETLYTQPCLYTIEAILADLLLDKLGQPDLVAGHSLGEYTALYTAGVFDFATGLQLVKSRAELMAQAAGGQMAALMKFDRQALEKVVAEQKDVVIANDNSEQQVVISGTPVAVETIMQEVKSKRAVTLKVSGAFHSPLMMSAAQEFAKILEKVDFQPANIPVLSNVDPQPSTDNEQLKQRLLQQMTGSVRWREIMWQLSAEGIEKVVEVGPGKVLSGLIKRTIKGIDLINVSSPEDITVV